LALDVQENHLLLKNSGEYSKTPAPYYDPASLLALWRALSWGVHSLLNQEKPSFQREEEKQKNSAFPLLQETELQKLTSQSLGSRYTFTFFLLGLYFLGISLQIYWNRRRSS
jgi:hypothetical protein